jgi:hypothetical protein
MNSPLPYIPYYKLHTQDPEIFIYLLDACSGKIDGHTLVSIDATGGGWATLSSQRAIVNIPEKRLLRGKLAELDETFLKGLRVRDKNVVNAILCFTRGTRMPMIEKNDPRWAITEEKACLNCLELDNPFDGCIVLQGHPGFNNTCSNCLLQDCRDTCEHRLSCTTEHHGPYVPPLEDLLIQAQGHGTLESPIDLTEESYIPPLTRSKRGGKI